MTLKYTDKELQAPWLDAVDSTIAANYLVAPDRGPQVRARMLTLKDEAEAAPVGTTRLRQAVELAAVGVFLVLTVNLVMYLASGTGWLADLVLVLIGAGVLGEDPESVVVLGVVALLGLGMAAFGILDRREHAKKKARLRLIRDKISTMRNELVAEGSLRARPRSALMHCELHLPWDEITREELFEAFDHLEAAEDARHELKKIAKSPLANIEPLQSYARDAEWRRGHSLDQAKAVLASAMERAATLERDRIIRDGAATNRADVVLIDTFGMVGDARQCRGRTTVGDVDSCTVIPSEISNANDGSIA